MLHIELHGLMEQSVGGEYDHYNNYSVFSYLFMQCVVRQILICVGLYMVLETTMFVTQY